jgi:hypothetical protein
MVLVVVRESFGFGVFSFEFRIPLFEFTARDFFLQGLRGAAVGEADGDEVRVAVD